VGNDQRDIWRAAAILSTVGITMALSVFVGFGLGYLLDRWLGTAPWFAVAGIVLGVVAGFREAYQIIRRFAKHF